MQKRRSASQSRAGECYVEGYIIPSPIAAARRQDGEDRTVSQGAIRRRRSLCRSDGEVGPHSLSAPMETRAGAL